jgi:hypothetical protein
MALLDETGTILVDDAGLMWRKPRAMRPSGLHGLEGLGDLGFDWEGFGQAAAGIGGAVAGIIVAKKTGYAPQIGGPQGGVSASASGLGSSAGFSMSPQMMMMLGIGAVVLIMVMKK